MPYNTAELALDGLVSQDWWDQDSEWSTHRTDTGEIIVFTDTDLYVIGVGGAISRTPTGVTERVILD